MTSVKAGQNEQTRKAKQAMRDFLDALDKGDDEAMLQLRELLNELLQTRNWP